MNRLELLRYEKGVSREAVAKAVGLSAKQIGQYERGQATPRPVNAKALADYYEVTVAELLGVNGHDSDQVAGAA